MKISKFTPNKGKAQAMVEFAIVLPILLLVVYGLIEVGRFIFTYAFVSNATRQAVRYGSTSGVGSNGVPRYQDCAGIKAEAERVDFLNSFADTNIAITYDNPDTGSISFDGVCNGNTDSNVSAVTGDRVVVTINSNFVPIFPKFLPFLARTTAGGNPITVESSRTLLLKLDIAPPKEPTITEILSDDPDASKVWDYVTVKVKVTSFSGVKTPTGKVFITGAEENCTITLSGGTGSCNIRFLTGAVSPPKVITASYEGDADHDISSDTEVHTVNFAPAVVTIISDTPDPSLVSDTVTVSFKVTGAFGTPTGAVTITGQSSGCGTPIDLGINGEGSCTLNFTTTGKKTLTASYNGDAVYAPGNKTERHDVILPTETVTIIQAHSPDPSEIGQSVTVFVSVGGITPPSGTVSITGANTNCSFTLPATSCVVTFNSIGNKTITATFTSSNPGQTGSSDSVSHVVQLPATTTTISKHDPSPSTAGQPVTVTVNVTGGSTTPTGTVVITGADTNCNITLANGTGSCNVVFNTSGSKTLTANYGGDTLHAASNTTATHVVSEPPIDCSPVKAGLLTQTNGALSITIDNPLSVPLNIGEITVVWNHDKGHQTGSDKTLRLQFVNLNGTTFWQGDAIDPATLLPIIPNPPVSVQPKSVGPTTITFIFHQSFDTWDDTELVQIHFTNPGCVDLIQKQH